MQSSKRSRALRPALLALVVSAHAAPAQAQQQTQGFAVERFYPSAPAAGWFVMDALDMRGGLGGALALTIGYARRPLRITDGAEHLSVVVNQVSTNVGAAITYDRWRAYIGLDMPLVIQGESGTIGGFSATAPSVDLGSNPDTISDPRVGVDVRLLGQPGGRFRLGVGAQLTFPNGERANYDSDGTFRGMGRILVAGDVGRFTYAGHLGVHIRPLDDTPAPEYPRGSELLAGVAAGAKLPIAQDGRWTVIVGPEVYGATALRAFIGATSTALEGLLSSRLERCAGDELPIRIKLGLGGGINQHFGAPEWRVLAGVEVFGWQDTAQDAAHPTGHAPSP